MQITVVAFQLWKELSRQLSIMYIMAANVLKSTLNESCYEAVTEVIAPTWDIIGNNHEI